VKVVEHNTNPIDLHFSFNEHYKDHEFICHVREAIPLQLDALNQNGHLNIIHAIEHGHFPSFPIHQNF
jgi:hypothetical protein